MSISGPVRVQFCDDGVNVILLERITYTDSKGRIWSAPVGLVTDGASIPREMWTALGAPFTGPYRIAAIFHDAAYRVEGMDRDAADDMFRECAIECGCPPALADALFIGIRLGGSWAFAQDQGQPPS